MFGDCRAVTWSRRQWSGIGRRTDAASVVESCETARVAWVAVAGASARALTEAFAEAFAVAFAAAFATAFARAKFRIASSQREGIWEKLNEWVSWRKILIKLALLASSWHILVCWGICRLGDS